MITITFNNEQRQLPEATTVARFVEAEGAGDNVAVAVNNQVVPKAQWAATQLRDGDTLLIIKAFYGG